MEGEHRDAMMEAQHTHFLSIIREGIRPRVGLEEGLRALYVAEAMIRSTHSGSWESVQGRN
jgi:predicted dehydrogenase